MFLKNILSNKKLYLSFFLAALFLSTIFKILEVKDYNFAFTMDQGRDMVDIRHMVVTLTPRLVGPTTSINGVLLGPFWYYFNLIPFVFGGGDPSFIVYWQIIWYQLSAVTLWFVIKKKDSFLASIIAGLYLLMPVGFNTARYFWNANSMVFFTGFYFAALIAANLNPSIINLISLGILSGLAMQIEAAFGILFIPFAVLVFLCKRTSLKKIGSLILGFGLTLIPQILFELRHNFIMTKIFINEFTGKGEMLGNKISLTERWAQRTQQFINLIRTSNHLPENIVFAIFAIALVLLVIFIYRKFIKDKQLLLASLSVSFIIFSAIFYLIFPQILKEWYTLGLSVPIIFIPAILSAYAVTSKKPILQIVAVIFLLGTLFYTTKAQTFYIQNNLSPSNDRSNLKNELNALDWVYQNAQGKGFKVYSYLPSVYDYPYNHLFWWYGTSKYGYQPFDAAYLPDQPEYIKDVSKLWTKKKPLEADSHTFLIIEDDGDKPERVQQWLGNFSKLCLIKKEVFSWRAQVRMMGECNK